MKKLTMPVWALAAVLGLTLAVAPLAACSAGGNEAQEPAAAEDAAQDEAATESEAAEEPTPDEEPTADPVWVLSKSTQTYTMEDDESLYTTTYELDEHGNALVAQYEYSDGGINKVTYEYDEDGYVTLIHYMLADEEQTTTLTTEKDDQGRAIKITYSEGSGEEFVYDADGNLAEHTDIGTYSSEDPEGNETTGTFYRIVTYEDGLVKTVRDISDFEQVTEYEYQRDTDGVVTGYVALTYSLDDDGQPIEESQFENSATVEWDDNGNVARVTEEGEAYTRVTTHEYTQVADPSTAVRINAQIKPM